MQYRRISADCHLDLPWLPADLFTSQATREFKDRMPFVGEEVLPGPECQSEDEMIEEIRVRGVSNLHPVGTCRMGREVDAVVDPRLRVHGVERLRVADASIMPQVPGGNTNAPSIMIGEKCAAMVLEDAMAA